MPRSRAELPRLSARAELDAVFLNLDLASRRLHDYWATLPPGRPGPLSPRARRQLLARTIRFSREVAQLVPKELIDAAFRRQLLRRLAS
jgi:hypothetical protein